MGKIEEKVYDMRVRSITKIDREKEDSDSVMYRLMARDAEGINEITIASASPFKGISAHNGIIQVVIRNSQKSLADFKNEDEGEKD